MQQKHRAVGKAPRNPEHEGKDEQQLSGCHRIHHRESEAAESIKLLETPDA
jgi:hypothetical protein